MPGRSSPSPFRISAMSAPTTRTSRRRPRRRAASSSAAPITEPANYRADAVARRLAQVARHRRARRGRHPAADPAASATRARRTGSSPTQPDGRLDLAALREEAAGLARARRHGPGAARSPAGRATNGTRRRGEREARLRPAGGAALSRRRGRLRRQAQHPAHAGRARLPGHRGAGDRLGRGHPAPRARRHLSVERPGRPGGDRRIRGAGVARADRRRASRSSASASATRCWRWRSAAAPTRWTRAIAAPTTRSRTTSPARSRSPARTTASSSIPTACRPASSRPTLAVRRHQRGPAPRRQAGLLGAAPPRSQPRPAGQPLPVRALRRPDGGDAAAEMTLRPDILAAGVIPANGRGCPAPSTACETLPSLPMRPWTRFAGPMSGRTDGSRPSPG